MYMVVTPLKINKVKKRKFDRVAGVRVQICRVTFKMLRPSSISV